MTKEITRDFTPENIESVLGRGIVKTRDGAGDPISLIRRRTPLHVNYGIGPDFAPARNATTIENAVEFNTVGSRTGRDEEKHLPVLDIDGGAVVHAVKKGSKVILRALPISHADMEKEGIGKYAPNSWLRDVLGDHGISLEVFEYPLLSYTAWDDRPSFKGNRVSALVLRSDTPDLFAAVDSTNEGHSHVYVNEVMGDEDHKTLITELGHIGVIGRDWEELTLSSGMGIVRTPWTQGDVVRKQRKKTVA